MKNFLVTMVFILTASGTAGGTVIYYGDDFDLSIPDNARMPDAVINIGEHHTIDDLDVRINIIHANILDLQIFLQAPNDDRVLLNMYDFEKDALAEQDYVDTIFDDQAEVDIALGIAPFTGRFRPIGELSIFNGADCFGAWRLQIYDVYNHNTGYLQSFELAITNPEPATMLSLGIGGLVLFRKRRR